MQVLGLYHWFGHVKRSIFPVSMPASAPKARDARYGESVALIQSLPRFVAALLLGAGLIAGTAAAAPVKIVALGDSLTAGLGLPATEAFPARLEAALKARGRDVTIVNAGVSGDTASGGLARLDWSVGDDATAVIVELGANDALRGLDPKATGATLDRLLARLAGRHLPVLLTGMLAPRNFGADYATAFDAIYPDLARKYGVVFYPFFLDGIVTRPELFQPDGLHPNAAGVNAIVEKILPSVEDLLARTAKQS
jgi:acyl-CoA thioesterase-1